MKDTSFTGHRLTGLCNHQSSKSKSDECSKTVIEIQRCGSTLLARNTYSVIPKMKTP